jgi:hypothetical protein
VDALRAVVLVRGCGGVWGLGLRSLGRGRVELGVGDLSGFAEGAGVEAVEGGEEGDGEGCEEDVAVTRGVG